MTFESHLKNNLEMGRDDKISFFLAAIMRLSILKFTKESLACSGRANCQICCPQTVCIMT